MAHSLARSKAWLINPGSWADLLIIVEWNSVSLPGFVGGKLKECWARKSQGRAPFYNALVW